MRKTQMALHTPMAAPSHHHPPHSTAIATSSTVGRHQYFEGSLAAYLHGKRRLCEIYNGRCPRLNVCDPPKSACWNPNLSALDRIGSSRGSSQTALVLFRGDTRSAFFPPYKNTRRSAAEAQERVLVRTRPCCHPDPRVPALGTVRRKLVL